MTDSETKRSSAVIARGRRARSWQVLVRVALVLGGVAVALALSEGAARFLMPWDGRMRLGSDQFVESDVPGIPYLYRPNMKGRTNSFGLLNPAEVTQLPKEGTFRILVVGDSVTSIVMDEAPDKSSDLLYTALLEQHLNRRVATPVEVLNLSTPGLSLRQEITLIETRGLALGPQLIVVAYCYNDPVETEIGPHPNVVSSRLAEVAASRLSQEETLDPDAWYDGRSEVYRRLEASFASLGALAREHRVVVVGLPVLIDDRARQPHLAALETLTARNGIPYIELYADLTPARFTSFRGLVDDDPLHFNRAGHEAIAQALSEHLLPLVLQWPG